MASCEDQDLTPCAIHKFVHFSLFGIALAKLADTRSRFVLKMQSRGAECDDAAALTCNHEARGCRLITAPSLSQEGAKPQLREPLPLSLNSIHLDLDSEQTEQTRGSRAGCAKLAITMMGMRLS